MADVNNSITKKECEEFALLEKRLTNEQKKVIFYVMEGILLGEMAEKNIELKTV